MARSIFAQSTAFTYQAALNDSGNAASGIYDFGFALFCDGCSDPCCRITTNGVTVRNGLVTVTLDFGAGVFNGTSYLLEVSVRTNGAVSFTTLSPRQKITASPYAISAYSVSGVIGNASIAGLYTYPVMFTNAANLFAGDGGRLTGLNSTNLLGTVSVALGGTGASTAAAARGNLGAAGNGANSDITSLTGLTVPLSVSQGGSGSGSAAGALSNLGGASLSASNVFTGINVLTDPANVFAGSFTGDGSGLTGLNAASLSSGVIPVSRGGTGAGTASAARASLGAAASGVNADITALSGLNSPLSISQGGTAATTASNALFNLGAPSLIGSNTFSGVNTLSHPANLFAGTFTGDGFGLTGLNAGSFSSGQLSVSHGGTGAGTVSGARAILGAAASGANADITSLSALSTPLSVSQGGSGASTASNALSNLGGASLSGTNNFTGVNVLSHPANQFAGTFNGDGSSITGLNAANIASGLIAVTRGGTGAGTAPGARASLGAAASGINSDITSLTGLSTPLSINEGGTGAGSPSNALANLGAASLSATNTFSGINLLTNTGNTFVGSFVGNGAALTGLSASSLTGVIPSAQLAGNYSNALAFGNPGNTFAGTFGGDGSGMSNLNAASLSSGLVSVSHGGTGSGTAAGARVALGTAASGANSDITSLSGLATPLAVIEGGTGASTASNALVNLGAASLAATNTFAGINLLTNTGNFFVGSFNGNGAGLGALNATNLTSGTLPGGQLAGIYFNAVNFSNAANSFVGTFSGDGSALTNLNASAFSTGILPSAQLGGAYSNPLAFNNSANSFAGAFNGNAAGVSNVNAATVNGLASSSFWQIGGNAGTTAGPNFLGTTDGHPLELQSSSGVGINTNNPAGKALAVNGAIGISSNNTLEFAYDSATKQANAGKIGYQTLTPGALDIVGAGTNSTSRRIKFWAEAGAVFNGTGTNALLTVNNTVDEQTAVTFAAPFSTWRVGQNKPSDAPSAFDSFFVYQDSAAVTRLLITSDGRIGLNTNNPVFPLSLGNGAYCTAGGQWTSVSDRNAKEDFSPVQPKAILAKVSGLPISQWKYKAEPKGIKHLGPTAQDFHAAFGLGESERAIGTLDAGGVALAAIQGLSQVLEEKETEIEMLKRVNRETEQRLQNLEAQVRALLAREARAEHQ